jgi:uncharacterized membrane protein
MEIMGLAFGLLVLAIIVGGCVSGIVALVKVSSLRRNLEELRRSSIRFSPPAPPASPPPVAPARIVPPPTPPARPPPSPPAPAPAPQTAGREAAGMGFRAALRREMDDVLRGLKKIGIATAPRAQPEASPAKISRGEEPASPPLSDRQDWETRVGQRWMTWAGGLILFLGAAFFVKYAFENQWIGPAGRVSLGLALGIALLVAGGRFARRGYRALSQGVMGSGLAILYVSAFAGFSLYRLVPQAAAFAVMVLFTALGLALAVAHDALSMAVLAVLGGFLTPVLLSTGRDARDALFAYLTVLDLGVLAVAFFRRWRPLDVLAFAGTLSLYAGWFAEFYQPSALTPASLWLGLFYLIFLVLPFAYHLRRGESAPVERFVLALLNATYAFGYAYYMFTDGHRPLLGFVALFLAATNLVMGSLSRVRIRDDRRQVLGFLGMAVAFLTIAAPLHFRLQATTLAWAIEGPVLLYLGYRYRYYPLRLMAAAVLLLAGGRAFAVSFPDHLNLFIPIFNSIFGTAITVPAAAAVFAWIHRRNRAPTAADRAIMNASACASGVAALVFLTVEMSQWFEKAGAAAGEAAAYERYAVGFWIVLWTIGALVYLAAGLRFRWRCARLTGIGLLAVSAGLAVYSFGDYRAEPYRIFLNARFLAVLFQSFGVFACARLLRRFPDRCGREEGALRVPLNATAMAVLLALLSVEAYNYFHEVASVARDARWMSLGAVSLVWGLYAVVVLVIGFRGKIRGLRYAALGLFGLTIVKLVMVDMAGTQDVYRIIVFLALGLILIGVAYAYHRIDRSSAAGGDRSA